MGPEQGLAITDKESVLFACPTSKTPTIFDR